MSTEGLTVGRSEGGELVWAAWGWGAVKEQGNGLAKQAPYVAQDPSNFLKSGVGETG